MVSDEEFCFQYRDVDEVACELQKRGITRVVTIQRLVPIERRVPVKQVMYAPSCIGKESYTNDVLIRMCITFI